MVQRRLLLVLTTLFFLVAARQRAVRHPALPEHPVPPPDVFTYSNPLEVAVNHVALDLTVDFDARQLRGRATLTIDNRTGADELVLDTFDLAVTDVRLDDGSAASWSVGEMDANGAPLTIAIAPATTSVTIDYSTSPGAPGLNWNTAAQSFGRKQPYLYTLSEPIDARSWIPIQDTPSTRMTYSATVRVPPDHLALMSAADNARETNETGIYTFNMPYRIPAYLIALAVGRLEYRPLDERTGVYAEPELIEDAEWDLQYLPEMVDVAEEIAGPFPFSRHDVLLMPPTFTVGGMEHPMLNFINPFSVVTGHRPAVPEATNLIAHELAHSWSGDLATLATWNDVWLNEGITSYLAARIVEEMSGVERAELTWFLDRRNYTALVPNVDAEITRLHRQVPYAWAGFDSTGYTKGALFIRTLEDEIGRATFDDFLRRYFQTFAWQWVSDQSFLELLRETVLDSRPGLEERLHLEEWIYGTGLPSTTTAPTSSVAYSRASQRASSFVGGTPMSQLDAATWPAWEADLFLQMISVASIRPRMAEVDAAFGFSFKQSPPLSWILRAVSTGYRPSDAAVDRALARGGTNGSITQIYNVMNQVDRERALGLFAKYRDRYHDAIEARVAEILGLVGARTAA